MEQASQLSSSLPFSPPPFVSPSPLSSDASGAPPAPPSPGALTQAPVPAPTPRLDLDEYRLPWTTIPTFVLFGIVAVAVAVAAFAYTTRCPCADASAETPSSLTGHVDTDGHSSSSHNKPFVESPLAELKSTIYVLSWQGEASPTESLKVHFLLNDEPYSTFSCNARDIFGSHGRVRVTLPKGSYTVRAVFGDTSQSVSDAAPQGGLVTLTETTLATRILTDHVAAADVEVGVCSRDK